MTRVLAPAALAFTLVIAAEHQSRAADAGNPDVQVNLDVLDSLAPAAAGAASTNVIHLHPPKPKVPPKPAPALAVEPGAPATAAAPPVAATLKKSPAAATPAAAQAAPTTPETSTAATTPSPSPAPAAPPATATAAPTGGAAPSVAATPAAASSSAVKTTLPPTRLLFAAGAADLPPGAKSELDAVANWLETNTARLEISAYAGGTADETNQARRLSLTRALAVRSYLIERGVSQTRMEVRALGNKSLTGDPEDRVDVVMMEH